MREKKTNVGFEAEPSGKLEETVRIHNRFAGRPLMFQMPGKSVRLGPGESETVPKDCLNAHELQCLCSSGLVVVEDLAAKGTERRKSSATTSTSAREAPKVSAGKETQSTLKAPVRRSEVKSPSIKAPGLAAKTGSGGKKEENK